MTRGRSKPSTGSGNREAYEAGANPGAHGRCARRAPGGANITPTGIGDWSDADFLKAIRTLVRPNGTTIAESMPAAYRLMTDDELKAIRAYLRTVPAIGKKTKSQDGQAE